MKKIIFAILVIALIGWVLFANKAPEEVSVNLINYEDPATRATFQYPETISARYLSLIDWPPKVGLESVEFACVEAGEESARAGQTEKRMIDGEEYCVTTVTEGAAGSIYTQYAYARTVDNRKVFLTFSTRAPQCSNYDEPERSECTEERSEFSMDDIIHGIFETLKLDLNTPKEEITYVKASADMIRPVLPFPGAVTGKEFSVTGEARGNWFFEASFPIDVLDKDGKILVQTYAQAQGEWMTTEFVPFKGEVKVPETYIGPATLVLKKDNPSGLPEHDAEISYPITIEY